MKRDDLIRHYVQNLGFKLTPVRGKRPYLTSWQTRPVTQIPAGENIGLIHGPSGTATLDSDHQDAGKALAAVGVNLEALQASTPYKIIGNPAKPAKMLFRVPDGFNLETKQLRWPDPGGKLLANGQPALVTVFELRGGHGKGYQDVLPSSVHPDTKTPYTWVDEKIPPDRESIPELPKELLLLWQNWADLEAKMKAACPWARPAEPVKAKTESDDDFDPDIVSQEFNKRYDCPKILERNHYTKKGSKWLAPNSSTGIPGVVYFKDDGKVYSHQGSDVLADGLPHDAFDLYAILEHAGDKSQAWHAAVDLLGIKFNGNGNRNGHNVTTVTDKAASQRTTREARKPRTSADYLEALGTLGYTFRINDCNDFIEVNGKPITDDLRAEIRTRMRDMGFRRDIRAIEDAYVTNARANRYHPVQQYLEGLEWDGYPHIVELAAFFTDADHMFGRWLTKWLVGAVARVFTGSQNPMLVLDGPQGIGKSHFAAWLGGVLGIDYFLSEPINPDDKDSMINLMSKFVWEVGELGATTRKADREALKHFITRQQITVRTPYGRHSITKPAMASLIGTFNNESGLLNDPTGSRRFLVCEITDIDWSYSKIDPNQIWAEAYHLYKDGYDWRLTRDEAQTQVEINERYKVDSYVAGMFLKIFDFTTDPDNPRFEEWMSSADILQTLTDRGMAGKPQSNLMELASSLRALGIVKRKRRLGNAPSAGYQGVWLKH